MKQPCKKECPGRHATCHAERERYRAFRAAMDEKRKERLLEQEAMNAYCDGMKRRSGYCPMR